MHLIDKRFKYIICKKKRTNKLNLLVRLNMVAGDRNQLDLLRAEKAIKALKTNENFLDLLITSKGLSPIKP